MSDPKILVALDYANEKQALAMVDQLEPELCHLKIMRTMLKHYNH